MVNSLSRPFKWTSENEHRLRRLAADGKSGREIAAAIGTNRNSVLGKANRLKVKLSGAPEQPRPSAAERAPKKTSSKQKASKSKASTPVTAAPGAGRASAPTTVPPVVRPAVFGPVPFILVRPNQCRFAIDPRPIPTADMTLCGARSEEGSSWCTAHAALVFTSRQV